MALLSFLQATRQCWVNRQRYTGDGSSVSVGDINNTSAFIARNNVNVDNITVTSGSSLTLTPSARWSAANGTVNNGTLTLESGSVLDGPLFQNGVLLFGTDKNASSVINTSLTNKGILMLIPTSTSAGNTLTVMVTTPDCRQLGVARQRAGRR